MSGGVLDRLDAVVDELLALDHDALSDQDVLEVSRRLERARRRLVVVDHASINQMQQRSLAYAHGARSTTAFLSNLLRVGRGEAHARIQAAEALGYRRTVTGCLVAPQFPVVAAAQADGLLSERHAAVIVKTVTKLPEAVADAFGGFVEKTLTERAADLDPTQLAGHAAALAYALDQDGQLAEDRYRQTRRGLDLHRRPDGSARLEAELTAEAAELLATALDPLTKPAGYTHTDGGTDTDGDAGAGAGVGAGPDLRTPSQRRHDALLALLQLAVRAGQLPHVGGVATTVVLTLDAEAWLTGTGTAHTGHGFTIPAAVAKRWTGHGLDARFLLALLSKTKAVEAYSSFQRIFTAQQRLALIARDGGCSFPGCDAPPAFTEAHHITDWACGGPTSLANGTLACCHHHRHTLEHGGWQVIMHDGRPHWIPPRWIDPDQTPRRNTRHDRPADELG